MSELRNLGQIFKAGNGPWERRLLLWLVTGIVAVVVVIVAAYYFDAATESNEFCGLLCHPNRPEYVTHEVSAHAEVECGTCHVGPGLAPKVTAKIFGAGELFKLVTNTYDRPIAPPVERLRPASDICEQCHSPAKPYGDVVRRISHFAADSENSETQIYLILSVSGDPARPEQKPGAHWHVENPVQYVALDPARQDIPWAGVTNSEGKFVEYWAKDSATTPEELKGLPRWQMDCLDCHNRATHVFPKPERSVDEALTAGYLDRSLPYIKREAIRLLSATYATQEAGLKAMEEIRGFYSSQYPAVYAARQESVAQAVETLQDIYGHAVFPEMNVNWQTYPNNIGHTDSPGCFRCHDGQHLNQQGDSIPLNCNTCHSVPLVVTRPDQKADLTNVFDFMAQAGKSPDSHRRANFARDHRVLANESCASCHGSIQFGSDNSSFCANQACHGQKWPEVALEAAFPHPVKLTDKHAQASCNECHKGVARPTLSQCADCHRPAVQPHFGSECSKCHTPTGWKESATAWRTNVPSIPHLVEKASNCVLCHSQGGLKPAPLNHQGIPGEACVQCHEAVPIAGLPAVRHLVEGRDNCLSCHMAGGLKSVPASHKGRTNESCLLCHERRDVGQGK